MLNVTQVFFSKNWPLCLNITRKLSENEMFSLNFEGKCSGSRDGAVARALASHQCGPGSIPGPTLRHMLVEFGIGSLLCSEMFFSPSPGTTVFPSPQKPTFPNSNSILECTDVFKRAVVNSSVLRG